MLFLFLLFYTLFAISVGFTPTFIIEPKFITYQDYPNEKTDRKK